MKYSQVYVYCGGIEVSLIAVKKDELFFRTISRALYKYLQGLHASIRIGDEGILVESPSIPDGFLGSTIPFFFQNRALELRVMKNGF
jgi:hypothetical protein